ncbi:MAG: hypothetical protein ACRELV_03990 [Longimicrobiales bacterium]
MNGTLFLKSGKWRWGIEGPATGQQVLELVDPSRPQNRMSVGLPFSWRQLPQRGLAELARAPEVRLWLDEQGILWRVTEVGPGTRYPYPLARRHLVFDSEHAWAGIVEFGEPGRLGDLTSAELQRYRSRMADFGGRRRAYRPPQ